MTMARKLDPVRQYLSDIGRRGGQVKVPKGTALLTEEQRKERGRAAAKARWSKKRKPGVAAARRKNGRA
jgi:hypothetical protein